ncbi:hypothetical protein ABPG75_004145 [Micractinium tetrahymenae]
MSVYKRLRACAKDGDRRAALLLSLDNGRGAVAPQLQERGLKLAKWSANAPGRALFSAADGSGLHLAVVAKDLVLASEKQAEQLRRDAPGEAETWAARAERELLAAGAPCTAVSSAVCFARGHLDWVVCAFRPEASGSPAFSLSAMKREAARLDAAFCPQASPFHFPSLSPSPLPAGAAPLRPASAAGTVPGGEGLPTPTIAWPSAMAAATPSAAAATPARPPASTVKNLVAALEQQAEAQAHAAACSPSRKTSSPGARSPPAAAPAARSPTRKPMLPCVLPPQPAERSGVLATSPPASPAIAVSSCGDSKAATSAGPLSVTLHFDARPAPPAPAAAADQAAGASSAGFGSPIKPPDASSSTKPGPPQPARGTPDAAGSSCSGASDAATKQLTWQLGAAAGAAAVLALACSLLRR